MRYKSVVIRKENEELVAYSVISPILHLDDYSNIWKETSKVMKEIYEAWKVGDWYCKPTWFKIWNYLNKSETDFPKNAYSCLDKTKEVQIDMKKVGKISKNEVLKVNDRFKKWKFNMNIASNLYTERGGKFIFSGKSLTLMINDKLWTFKREDDKLINLEINFILWFVQDIKWNQILIQVDRICFKNLILVNSIADITKHFRSVLNIIERIWEHLAVYSWLQIKIIFFLK